PTDLPVAGVRDVAAGVADSGLPHPVDLAEGRLHTPKASRGECRPLGSVRSVTLKRRCQSPAGVAVPAPHHVHPSSNTSASAKPAPGIPPHAHGGDAAPGRPQSRGGAPTAGGRRRAPGPHLSAAAARHFGAGGRLPKIPPARAPWSDARAGCPLVASSKNRSSRSHPETPLSETVFLTPGDPGGDAARLA